MRDILESNGFFVRLRCAWHVLRGRPLVFKIVIRGANPIYLPRDTMLMYTVITDSVIKEGNW